MKSRTLSLTLIFTALLLVLVACSFSTARIEDAWMSSDAEGSNRTTTFSQDAVFYAQVDLRNAPDDTQLKASWIAVQAEGADPNFVIQETDFTTGSGMVNFELSNTNLWPTGSYKVDIYMNGELAKTLEFTVQ
ncbi:MAG: hypothetical protein ACK2T2_06680 [Anaerolineales bacterium]|jgi:hypothetical protein